MKTLVHLLRSWRPILAAFLLAWSAAQAATGAPVILVVGDSISAAYGLAPEIGWVNLLSLRLAELRYPHRVVNASITGDTTAGGLARLPGLLAQHRPAIVIVELGGNDGLRGGSLRSMRDNLDAMVKAVDRAGAKALLVGMRLPPNYGPAYTTQFAQQFATVARDRKVALVPFLFERFGTDEDLFQADRIHPTAEAQPLLLDTVWPMLKPLIANR